MKEKIKQAWATLKIWIVDISLVLAGLFAWLLAVAILLTFMYTKCEGQSLLPTMAEMSSNGQIYNISLDRGELCMTSQRPSQAVFISLKVKYQSRNGDIYYLYGDGWAAVATFSKKRLQTITFTRGMSSKQLKNVKKSYLTSNLCPICGDPYCPRPGYNSYPQDSK